MSNEALAQNATQMARSTPTSQDFTLLVREVADTKTNIGISLRGKHGEQSLFSGVCKLVKSMLGMEREAHLPDDVVAQIREAITKFWTNEFSKVLQYGEVQSITYDKPSARIKAAAVQSVSLNARIHVARELPDGKEKRFFTLCLYNQAATRLGKMKDRPDLYDRKDLAAQEIKVTALEKEHLRLEQFVKENPDKP